MPKLRTALRILSTDGPVALTKHAIAAVTQQVGIGISFQSYRPIHIAEERSTEENIFDTIYRDNLWNSSESLSGPGSELAYTVNYRSELSKFIQQSKIRSMFDAPCGDLNWIGEVIQETGISYIGGDISRIAVARAKERRPDLEIMQFNICQDKFPRVDVLQCRDCLFHLSFKDIRSALERFVDSEIPYALITTNTALYLKNLDIETGGCRYLDLEKSPFFLPRPSRRFVDFRRGKDFPRFVGVWRHEQIERALSAGAWGRPQQRGDKT